MKLFIPLLLLISSIITAQNATEIYLFDLEKTPQSLRIKNAQNISQNNGYDNQPSFVNDHTLVYAATRNGQTDILTYDIASHTKTWSSNTTEGSEYSPLKIPNQNAISAIRLDNDGKQLLYQYDLETQKYSPITEDLVIGYHVWVSNSTIVSFVLGKPSNLVVTNTKKNTHKTVAKNIGRALCKIPNSNLVSYISKENELWEVRSLNPKTGATKKITTVLEGSEDMCWTPDGNILMGKGNKLYKFHPKKDTNWIEIASLEHEYLDNITRIAVNPSGNKIALVVNESPETVVQKQLDAYNARDIDRFMKTYAKEIALYNFPEILSTKGWDTMKLSYTQLFEQVANLKAEIKNRIIIGNKVIDEEQVTYGERLLHAVAIYEVNHGKITKVTFLRK